MTTQLAIGYLVPARRPRGAAAPASAAHVTEHDAIDARPAIPQAVVAWTDADLLDPRLPAGAGDPATAISGPPSFSPIRLAPPGDRATRTQDGTLFAALGVLLMALAGAVALELGTPGTTWVARDTGNATLALAGRVPVVEMRVVSVQRVEPPTVVAKR